tara:strand:- start:372 stop:1232 length:861 start_codon:yes stop_codon:yes gene_type:complete
MKFIATEKIRLKLASGIYSQNILSTVSDRDIVNLFSGIISSPDAIPEKPDGTPYPHKLQKAKHLILGLEFDVNTRIDFQIEGYIKDFTQLTNINRNMTSNSDDEFLIETGIAKGLDALIKYKSKRLYLWAVYSLGLVERTDNVTTYAPHFDRRHNINLVASYQWGKNKSWKADARWNLGSGFPFTQTQGFYENITFSNNLGIDYTSINGDLDIKYAELNKGRLPYYHRLDLSISKKVKISNQSELEISASVTNAYNRENIFYFNRVKHERINQLPLMPSLGVSLTF